MPPELLESPSDQAETSEVEQPTELSTAARSAAVEMFKGCMREEQWARRQEVRDARRQRFYERGDQYISWDWKTYSFVPAADTGEALPTYTNVYNIYRPYMRSLVSVLSQNPPGNDFIPNDLSIPTDIDGAKAAEKMRHRVDREVQMKQVQNKIARFFCTDSRVIARCWADELGAHVEIGGTLEWKVPIYTTDKKYWSYAINSEELPIDWLKEQFPDYAEQIVPHQGSAESSYERIARLGVLAGTKGLYNADADKHLVTRHVAWIRPTRYYKLDDAAKAEFEAMYPDGVRLTLCGDVLVEDVSESMDSVLVNGHPSSGDGQNHASLMKDCVPLQDDFNDGMNQCREFFDYGIPTTWFSEDAVDAESIPDQDSAPASYHPAKVPSGMALQDAFFQESPAVLPAGLVDWLTSISNDLAQFITGALPAMWGAGMTDGQSTLGGQQMDRDQAMGGLSVPWSNLQQIMAKITELTVLNAANQLGDTEIAVPAESGFEKFNVGDVLLGKWGCHPDTDSSFPETTAAKRAAFQSFATMVGQTPEGLQILQQPDNQKLALQYSGLEDFDIPGAQARDKQLREIQKLLAEQPVMPTPEEMQAWRMAAAQAEEQGLEPPPQPMPQPSVPVDEDWDYHQAEADKVKQWLSSDDRVTQERASNLGGIENVRLHGKAHLDALARQTQAQQVAQIPQKPISISASLKDLPPAAQAAKLTQSGLPASPDAVIEHDAEQKTAEALKKL